MSLKDVEIMNIETKDETEEPMEGEEVEALIPGCPVLPDLEPQESSGTLDTDDVVFLEGDDKYVFDKNEQIWRSQPPINGTSMDSPKPILPPSKKQSIVAKFVQSKTSSRQKLKISNSAVLDWILLATLGIGMAILSFAIDWGIFKLQHSRERILHALEGFQVAQFFGWSLFAVVLVAIAAAFCRYIGPQAIGSGIPEMKTSIRGVMLREYLTFRTFVAKVIGLTLLIGSGTPAGKEGPFVHLGSIMAHQLARLAKTVTGAYSNESRKSEMLAAGCAVGIACTFSSPVGGVLYSIEATSVYFGTNNYKRCFLAATFSSTIYRVLLLFFEPSKYHVIPTVVAIYQTNFPKRCFSIDQLPLFGLLGLICGLTSAFYVFIQRRLVYFVKGNKYIKFFTVKYWVLYPVIIMFMFGAITFPAGLGQHFAGERLWMETVKDLFNNCSWSLAGSGNPRGCTQGQLGVWSNYGKDQPMNILLLFFIFAFISIAMCSTLPVPIGAFIPTLVLGGAIGRFYGEVLLILMPHKATTLYAGIYAVVGASSFCSGATHSVSVAVIMYEVTGQLHYTIPILIGVLTAHGIAKYLQPSLYDSIIQIKKLPYLPDISHISQEFIGITADQFMTKNVKYLSHDSTLNDVRKMLDKFPGVQTFPICDSHRNQILIGSCHRRTLQKLIDSKIGPKAYTTELSQRLTSHGDTQNGNEKMIKNEAEALLMRESQPVPSIMSWKLHSFTNRKKQQPNGVLGFSIEERAEWETQALNVPLNLEEIEFDTAPFQLMERAPLLHVHMIFTLLKLRRAYITKCGKLEGLISQRELRKGIEDVKAGLIVARQGTGKINPIVFAATAQPEQVQLQVPY